MRKGCFLIRAGCNFLLRLAQATAAAIVSLVTQHDLAAGRSQVFVRGI